MRIENEMAAAEYGIQKMAEDSKVSFGYMRLLAGGFRAAGPRTLPKVADAFVRHAVRLLRLAARLYGAAEEEERAQVARAAAAGLLFNLEVEEPAGHVPTPQPPRKVLAKRSRQTVDPPPSGA